MKTLLLSEVENSGRSQGEMVRCAVNRLVYVVADGRAGYMQVAAVKWGRF